MKTIKEFKDAPASAWFVIKPRHAMHCKPRDPFNCVNARAIQSIAGVVACKVYKTVTYILWDGDDLPTRYQNSPDAIYFASVNDKRGRKAIADELRDEIGKSVRVELQVPRRNISKKHLRSEKMKETRKLAKLKREQKDAEGKPVRSYTKPSTEGMRSGAGFAHIWP